MIENAEGTLPSAFYAGHQFPNAHCVRKARHTHQEQEEEGKMPSSSSLSGPRAVVRSPPSSDGDLRPYLKKFFGRGCGGEPFVHKRFPPPLSPLTYYCGAAALLSLCLLLSGCMMPPAEGTVTSFSLEDIPAWSGEPYVAVDGNQPDFPEEDMTSVSFETYSELDTLGRCGVAYANVGQDLMPTEDRESISSVTPSGWINREYDGEYLYNRCHLIGFQLTGENANEENLITGTRYMNVDGMLPFENLVADYVKETDNHVLYRVTPVFEGQNLVASGVQMEAWSVEDEGEGVCFNVYVYNVQPGITIDYATGESWQEGAEPQSGETTYILNTNSHKFHDPDCSSVSGMSTANRQEYTGSREDLIAQGYTPCGQCNP